MKHVVLCADNELKVYLFPDFIAESRQSFHQICTDFSLNWKARLIRPKDWYDEKDFVEYLNEKVCKEEKCVYVESIGWDCNRKKWPEKYRKCYLYAFKTDQIGQTPFPKKTKCESSEASRILKGGSPLNLRATAQSAAATHSDDF